MLRFLMIYGVFASMGAMACTPPSAPAPVQPKAAPPPPKTPGAALWLSRVDEFQRSDGANASA